MITDERVFDPELVPDRDLFTHRNTELNEITGALNPVVDGKTAENVYLFGPSGAGKTLTTQIALQQLRNATTVDVCYINCWDTYERYDITFEVCRDLVGDTDLHRQSTARKTLLNRLQEEPARPRIVVLDETDQLANADILYDIHRCPKLSVILIANREDELFARLEPRVRSRYRAGVRVTHSAYTDSELTSILKKRAEHGLRPGVVTHRQLNLIARHADGDARVAIQMLKSVARYAAREELTEVTSDVIESAMPEARDIVRKATLEQVTDDQRVLYNIIEERGMISPGNLYERYCERVDDPRVERTVRTYLQKMEHYDLIRSKGNRSNKRWMLSD